MFIGGSNLADAYLDESDRILTRSNALNPSNDIDFLAGRIWLTNGSDRRLYTNSGTITKKLNTAFAVGHNQGMLDTGTVGDNTYHLYAIGDSSGTIDFLASLSLTAPTMPTGFSYRKRVASITRVGGANRKYKQIGRYFQFPEDIVALNGYAVSTSGELIVMPVPRGIRVVVRANLYPGFSNGALVIKVLDGDLSIDSLSSDVWGNGFRATVSTFYGGSYFINGTEIYTITNTSAQIYFRRAGSYYGSAYQTVLQVHGYEDFNL
jgi:hypothetical protein